MSSSTSSEVTATPSRRLTEKVSLERARWFDQHILPHEDGLRAWCRRRRLGPEDIDDIIQEAYTILASRDRLDDLAHPSAYLYRIVHSLVIRDARRARIVPFEPIDKMERLDAARDPFSPERIAIGREDMRRMAAAIQTMPARVRDAFVMRRVEGYSQREIAKRMAITESTVEKHIAKGLALLIQRLGHSGNISSESLIRQEAGKDPVGATPRDSSDSR
ncbi:RNA polymerase sigma factor [Brevundimonas diminuta]|uniref:RNA polymerase sigma factor n=1 Tax=Brevundimonas diminuta TaxID=293 RepID=UPI003D032A7C